MTDVSATQRRTRGRNDHFTEAELSLIKQLFEEKMPKFFVARKLNCSLRVVQTHYSRLQGRPPSERKSRAGQDAKPRRAEPATERPSRFYKSNFEL